MSKKRNKYQVGIQDNVYNIIKEAKKKGLPFITKADIIKNLKQKNITLRNVETQVGQALYQLQRMTKFRRRRIKKYYNKKTKKPVGWTTYEDKINL